MEMANRIVDSEDLIDAAHSAPSLDLDRRRMDLALNLVDEYYAILGAWSWGDSILEWIRQCEITFETSPGLRPLLKHDVWPHAGRSSFVQLLEDKHIDSHHCPLERAVGLCLTFRQPPPIGCFSNQFLFYLKNHLAQTAYHTWTQMSPGPLSSLPPERFGVQVVEM